MKYCFLIVLAAVLIGCTPKISCNSFSLRMAIEEDAAVDQKLYEKVKIASSHGAPPEELWVLRLPVFDGRDLEAAKMTRQPPPPPELINAMKSLNMPIDDSTTNGGQPEVTIKLKDEAKAKLATVTATNVGKKLAIILDGEAIMAPIIREPLNDVEFKATGSFTSEEANRIADRINQISQCK